MNVYSDDIKKRQAYVLASINDNCGIHGFFDICEDKFKPFFKAITDILRVAKCIPFGYSVSSMWFNDSRLCSYDEIVPSRAYFDISSHNSNYNERKVTSGDYLVTHSWVKVSEKTLSAILDECDKLVADFKRMREEAKNTPSVSDIMETLLKYAQKYVDGNLYSVSLEKGKLNLEGDVESYDCLVVRYKDNMEYHSSIKFSKNDIGEYFAKQRVPLCGESTSSFKLEDAEETIKNIINF